MKRSGYANFLLISLIVSSIAQYKPLSVEAIPKNKTSIETAALPISEIEQYNYISNSDAVVSSEFSVSSMDRPENTSENEEDSDSENNIEQEYYEEVSENQERIDLSQFSYSEGIKDFFPEYENLGSVAVTNMDAMYDNNLSTGATVAHTGVIHTFKRTFKLTGFYIDMPLAYTGDFVMMLRTKDPVTTVGWIPITRSGYYEMDPAGLSSDVYDFYLKDMSASHSKFLVNEIEFFGQEVTFKDDNLRKVILDALGKPEGFAVREELMSQITKVDGYSKGITDITGLEYAINAQHINLYNNFISDLTPIHGLTNVTWLNVNWNLLVDSAQIEPFRNKVNTFYYDLNFMENEPEQYTFEFEKNPLEIRDTSDRTGNASGTINVKWYLNGESMGTQIPVKVTKPTATVTAGPLQTSDVKGNSAIVKATGYGTGTVSFTPVPGYSKTITVNNTKPTFALTTSSSSVNLGSFRIGESGGVNLPTIQVDNEYTNSNWTIKVKADESLYSQYFSAFNIVCNGVKQRLNQEGVTILTSGNSGTTKVTPSLEFQISNQHLFSNETTSSTYTVPITVEAMFVDGP